MAEFTDDKTNDPTARRRQQARESGEVARSKDVSAAILLLGAVGGLVLCGRPIVDFFGRFTARQLGGEAWLVADVHFVSYCWNSLLGGLAVVVLPILGVIVLAAIAGNVIQVGLLFLPQKVLPDVTRIDPVQGLRRLLSFGSLSRIGMGLLTIVTVAAVAGFSLANKREEILNCGQLPLAELAVFLCETLISATLKIGVALLGLAAFDYALARWRHERQLRMTTQEIREELRTMHGDPQVANRRRALRRELSQMRLAAGAAQANVVFAVPHEVAVAVRYSESSSRPPVVVAKGTGSVAERIRAVARDNGVPIVADRSLADSLARQVAVNRPIPRQLFDRVAEVMAQVTVG